MVHADYWLLQMETHVHSFIRPNVLTYTSVICGLSRCKQNDMARKAEDILERMKRNNVLPDMVAYAAVINCWAKAVSRRERGIAAKRAISLLNEMEHLYITKKVYNVKPSTLTYTTVIAAIGNCVDPDASQLAEGIIQRMRNLHESGTIVNVKPNTATYNAVIFALGRGPISKRNPTALRAEKLLDAMTQRAKQGEWDTQPDVRTWAFVLRAWSRSKLPDAAEQAQRVLDKMERLYDEGLSNVRPNFVCYTTVMGAWGYSRSNNALDNMENILKRMEDQYTKTLEPDVRPNTVSYVTVRSKSLFRTRRQYFVKSCKHPDSQNNLC
jgi:pentatricopeptide repeat protein